MIEVDACEIMSPNVRHWTDEVSPNLASRSAPPKAKGDVFRNRRARFIFKGVEEAPSARIFELWIGLRVQTLSL
jgi:hypothetical protein